MVKDLIMTRRAVMTLAVVIITTMAAWAQTTSFPTASGGEGTEGNPYKIATTADLDALAADVNSGTAYSGTYFKMTADITYSHTTAWDDDTSTETNYTAIGNRVDNFTENPFSGTFDGDGHTVSGIRIYKNSGNSWADTFLGLFGFVLEGTVKNVTVADARITGMGSCGGIVGYVNAYYYEGTSTVVENCHALNDVAIHAVADGSNFHGGITGSGSYSTISGCTSAVTITAKTGLTDCDAFGGIVGGITSGTISNCLAIGVSIPEKPDGCRCGAITGSNDRSTLEYNSYANCNVGGTTTNIGGPWGDIETYENPETHKITNPDGAIPFDTSEGYIVAAGRGVTANGTKLYADAPYYRYASGTTVTLDYTGSVPTGYDFGYTVTQDDGTAVSMTGNATFTMPTAHVTADVIWIEYYTLTDHTIYCDGAWNTLCLPFTLATLTGTPLDGFDVKELDTETTYNGHVTGLDGTTLYLNFKDATAITAGRPYIVRKLVTDNQSAPTYTATEGSPSFTLWSDFNYSNLIDGNTGTYWRPSFTSGSAYCEFHSDAPVYVTGYTLTSGNVAREQDPKVWTLQAKLNEDDAWTVIDSRDANANSGDAVPSDRTKTSDVYTIQQPGAYQYFRFKVTANGGADYLCLSELTMQGKHLATDADVVNPTFYDVTPGDADPVPVASSDGTVTFVGSYTPVNLTAGDKSVLFLGAANTLYWPNADMTVGPYCALFRLSGNATSVRAFNLSFDISDGAYEITGISEIPGSAERSVYNDAWFDLNGRRLVGKPTVRGIYIYNGHKVVIK